MSEQDKTDLKSYLLGLAFAGVCAALSAEEGVMRSMLYELKEKLSTGIDAIYYPENSSH